MKVVILAGGLGTRISEESHLRPKPMIEIGGKPILWHIMKMYSGYGFDEFIICLGYKGYVVKEYFANYYLHMSDVTYDFRNGNKMTIHENVAEPWKVTLVDTGLHAQTGARLKKIQKYIGEETFMMTYGDGVSDINLNALINHHKKSGKLLTLTAVHPEGRFGVLDINKNNEIESFREKAKEDGGWINAGFMVLEPRVFDYLSEVDECIFEQAPLKNISKDKQLNAYKHNGFWKCMDTLRDKNSLEAIWGSGNIPWIK